MLLPLLKKRRTIRKYKDRKVEKEKINRLVDSALLSPSSMGARPWEFIIVQDKDTLEKLSKSKKKGSTHLKDAPLGIIVCVDPEESDVWIEDASIASTYLLLEVEHLDLGACWIQIRNRMHDDEKKAEEFVKELMNIPENLRVESIISIGYPDEKKNPYIKEDLPYKKVHKATYGNPFK